MLSKFFGNFSFSFFLALRLADSLFFLCRLLFTCNMFLHLVSDAAYTYTQARVCIGKRESKSASGSRRDFDYLCMRE